MWFNVYWMGKKQATIYIDDEVMGYLEDIMEKETRSFSQIVNMIIKDFKDRTYIDANS